MGPGSAGTWDSAAEAPASVAGVPAGTSMPRFSATRPHSSSSTSARLARVRSRTSGWTHLPSSKEKAATMWSRSGAVMLFQNIVAWVKWSSKDWGRSRTTVPATGRGTCRKPASPAWKGQPEPSELGK